MHTTKQNKQQSFPVFYTTTVAGSYSAISSSTILSLLTIIMQLLLRIMHYSN